MYIVADNGVARQNNECWRATAGAAGETIVNFNGKNYLGRQWEFPRENYIPRTTHY